MRNISDVLADHLEREGVRYYRNPDESAELQGYVLPLGATHCLQTCWVLIGDGERYLRLETGAGIKVEKRHYAKVCEYIAGANRGLKLGHFQLDTSTGDVAFVVAATLQDTDFSEPMLKRLIAIAVGTYDEWFPALLKVVFLKATPEEALAGAKESSLPRKQAVDRALARLFKNSETIPPQVSRPADDDMAPSEDNPSEATPQHAPVRKKRVRRRGPIDE